MRIKTSNLSDEACFLAFWNAALVYQRENKLPLWPDYPATKIREEVQHGLHFSVFNPNDDLVGYFSVVLSDPVIWAGDEKGDAIYIHRMCVNPAVKGGRLAQYVLAWACGYAAAKKRKYVRMDTWGDNLRLVDYYTSCGFRHIRTRNLGDVPELPPHYNNAVLALFQNEIEVAEHSGGTLGR